MLILRTAILARHALKIASNVQGKSASNAASLLTCLMKNALLNVLMDTLTSLMQSWETPAYSVSSHASSVALRQNAWNVMSSIESRKTSALSAIWENNAFIVRQTVAWSVSLGMNHLGKNVNLLSPTAVTVGMHSQNSVTMRVPLADVSVAPSKVDTIAS